MKKLLIGSLLMGSGSAFAQSCPVDVPNPIHIADGNISVYESGKPKLLIDENNNIFINGKKVDLNAMQQKAVALYSQNVQADLPNMAQLAQEGTTLATDVLNEISSRFDSKDAFTEVQNLISQYGEQAQQKFYNKEGEFIIPADVFGQIDTSWKTEFESAMAQLSVESVAGVFIALTEEMKNGDINFMELQEKFGELKAQITEQMSQRTAEMNQKANALCGSIENLAEEEQELQKMIPQLKATPMFEI